LVEKVEIIAQALMDRGANIGPINDRAGAAAVVRNSLNLLSDIIVKRKNNVFDVMV
jgi:hypothetical protein